ncbi:MAG: hypothetical protein N3B01_06235 [Verrucomicrobiae bacterium]|nr:hypothetical protein [Verrucomicrobiae bacterium]
MKGYYPIFLQLQGQPVVVVGAGKVAARKIRALRSAGARVTVIAPEISAAIGRMRDIHLVRRAYRRGDLRGACLVVAATDDLDVNRRVCAEAKRRRLLVNCAAPPDCGNFIVPSVVRRREFCIAISTFGEEPARAKRLRLWLERLLR